MFVVGDVNRGVRSGTGSAQVGARQGGRGGWCRRVLVGEDVHPLNVGAVPPCAIVSVVLLVEGARLVECEVFSLRFARRRSCAESMLSPAKWA